MLGGASNDRPKQKWEGTIEGQKVPTLGGASKERPKNNREGAMLRPLNTP